MTILPLLALLTSTSVTPPTPTPNVSFTADSTFQKANVLTLSVQDNFSESGEYVSSTLIITENYILGHQILDDETTDLVEGVKLDGKPIYNWMVENYDPTVSHTLLVKTIYADDISGTFAAMKDGNFEKALKDPVVLFQAVYYALSILALLIGALGIYKSKKFKAESAVDIAKRVQNTSNDIQSELTSFVQEMLNNVVTPTFSTLKTQNQDIIEALILLQNKDPKAQTALIDLLKNTSVKDISEMAENIKTTLTASYNASKEASLKAKENIAKLAQTTFNDIEEASIDNGRG